MNILLKWFLFNLLGGVGTFFVLLIPGLNLVAVPAALLLITIINIIFLFKYSDTYSVPSSGKQVEGKIYKIDEQCYKALDSCTGCLKNPKKNPNSLKSVSCPILYQYLSIS